MCVLSAFVFLGGKASQEPGSQQAGPQLRMHEGVPGPSKAQVRYGIGLAWLPVSGEEHSSSRFLLCQLRPRAIAQQAGLRQSLRSTSWVNPGRTVEGSWSPLPQLAGESFASPGPPSNRRPAEAGLLHWGLSVALRSATPRHRQFSGLASQGRRPRELPLPRRASLATSRWAEPASWLLSSFIVTALSRLASKEAAGTACSSSLSHGGSVASPIPPSNRQEA